MLSLMRRSANSWVIGLFFAIIIFVFALNFGPWAGNIGGGLSYAADVNGRVITLPEFQLAYIQQLRAIQNYRPDYTETNAEQEGLKQIVLEQLVSKELLANLARKNGLSVSDEELALFIKKNMFGDRAFDRETYRRVIYGNFHSTESQFETQIRRELLAEKMAGLLKEGAQITEAEILDAFNVRSSQVSLDVIRIDPGLITISVDMDDAKANEWANTHQEQVAHYYNQHISEFRKTPEKKDDLPTHKELKEVQGEIAKKIAKENQQKELSMKLASDFLVQLKSGASTAKLNLKSHKNAKAISTASTGFFRKDARFIPQIGQSTDVLASAFALSEKKPVADKVFEVNNAYFVVKLNGQENPDMKKFEKDKELIRASLLMMRQRQFMQNYVDYLKKQASIKYNPQIVGLEKSAQG